MVGSGERCTTRGKAHAVHAVTAKLVPDLRRARSRASGDVPHWTSPTSYRGRDRREAMETTAGHWNLATTTAAIAVIAAAAAAVAVQLPAHRLHAGHAALRTVVLFLALLLALSLHHLWLTSGRALAGRTATAAALLMPVAATGLPMSWTVEPGAVAVRVTATLLALGWLWVGIVGPEVDAALSPARDLTRAFLLLPAASFGLLLVSARLPMPSPHLLSSVSIAVAGGMTVILLLRPRTPAARATRPLVWAPVAVAVVEVARWAAPTEVTTARFVALAVLAGSLLLAIVGAIRQQVHVGRNARDHRYLATARDSGSTPAATTGSLERHDLRNAVSAVEAATRTLLAEQGQQRAVATDPRRAELRDALQAELTRIQRMLAPPGTQRAGPHGRERVDLRRVAREQAALVRADGHRVEVHGHAVPLFTDPVAVTRIVQNLLINGAEHGAGPDGLAHLDIEVARDGRTAHLTVRDRGPGIAPELRERLFEPYAQADAETDGEGLGLAGARMLANRLGGDLEVLEAAGPGAAFRLRLPHAPPVADDVDACTEPAA